MAKEKFKNFFFVFLDSVFTPPHKIVCQNQRLMSDLKAHPVCFVKQMLSVLCKHSLKLKEVVIVCNLFSSYLFCHTLFCLYVFFDRSTTYIACRCHRLVLCCCPSAYC